MYPTCHFNIPSRWPQKGILDFIQGGSFSSKTPSLLIAIIRTPITATATVGMKTWLPVPRSIDSVNELPLSKLVVILLAMLSRAQTPLEVNYLNRGRKAPVAAHWHGMR